MQLRFQNMRQVSNVADSQAQNLDFGQFLVGRQHRQELPQFPEAVVEGLYASPFTSGVCVAVLFRASSAKLQPQIILFIIPLQHGFQTSRMQIQIQKTLVAQCLDLIRQL